MRTTQTLLIPRPFIRSLVALVSVSAAMLVGCANSVDLRLHLTKGPVYHQKMTTQQHIVQEMPDRRMIVDQTMGFGCSMRVQDIDAQGVMSVQSTYDWVMMDQQLSIGGTPGPHTSYDSAAPPPTISPQMAPFSALKGAGFTFQIAPDGRVLAVHGFDAIMDRVMGKLGKELGPTRDTLIQTFRQQFNDDSMKRMLEQSMRIYPDHRVKVGDSWTQKVVVPMAFMPMTLETTYVLTGLKKGVASVRVDSKAVESTDAAPMQMGAMQMRLSKFSGTQSGTGEIDASTGLYRLSDLKQNFTMTLDLAPSPSAPAGGKTPSMTLPMTLESTVKIEARHSLEWVSSQRWATLGGERCGLGK